MDKRSLAALGALTAAFSTACISILGNFQVGECPSGQTSLNGTCVPVDAGPVDITPKSCSDSNAPVCGDKRVCSDTGGKAVCVCKPEYTGAECGACGDGLQDNNGDGTCENTCAKAAPNCGVHAACSDTSGSPKCDCVPGYAVGGDSTCAFAAGPLDPDFQGSPPNVWTVVDGSVDLDAGVDANGVARITACPPPADGWGNVKQTFLMPSVAESQPVALKVRARGYCSPTASPCYGGSIGFGTPLTLNSLYINGSGTADTSMFTSVSSCLGERASGTNVPVELQGLVSSGYFCYSATAGTRFMEIDSFGIAPDSTCPPFGVVKNGNFEANGDWTAAGGASVDAVVGNNNSKAAHLVDTVKCPGTVATLTGTASPPWSSMPSAALQFTYKGTNGKVAAIDLNGMTLAGRLTGTGTYQDVSVCVPEGLKGFVSSIALRNVKNYLGGTCSTDAEAQDSVFDDFKFASVPDLCPDKASIVDGSFERTDPGSPWALTSSYNAYIAQSNLGTGAHNGSQAIYMAPYYVCSSLTAKTTATVPAVSGAEGPVVRFFYRLSANTGSSFSANWSTSYTSGSTPISTNSPSTWTEGKMCIPANQAGRPFTLSFNGSNSNSGTCGASGTNPYGTVYIDDVTVGTDPSCPTTP